MKKMIIPLLIGSMFSAANAASLENINISGFGSVAVGKSNNDAGYAGYDSESWNVLQDSLAGLQLDVKVNLPPAEPEAYLMTPSKG